MAKEESHVLHIITQVIILPLLIAFFILQIMPSLNDLDILALSVLGALVPDIDHINIWFEYKFKNFRSFVRFLTHARRYRYSFLIFHNVGAMIAIVLLIPIVGLVSTYGSIFLVSFLFHILLDFLDDKVSLGRVTHWRYRRRT